MAKLNLDYYSGEDLYSDGDVENEILKLVKSGEARELDGPVSFPVLYHLSKVRENILNWYPFHASGRALEIGAGCGAITGLLCDRLSQVTSVELSRRRSEINYQRNQDRENLEIRVGNLNDMEFEEPFDYVILNGVFEYAMSFTEGEKPYEAFLNKVRGFLRPDGILLVAIENRLGLKYFAGAPEDHTDGYFDGIRGYQGNRSVRTFSRGEWEQLMRTCQLEHYRFYYPYPDYKFPKEIFTDESLAQQHYGRPSWNFNESALELFSETEVAKTLQQEGVMAQFANSFLIEMSREPLPAERRVDYAKLSTDREERFAIGTVLERVRTEDKRRTETRFARKIPMTEAAGAHIDQMTAHMGDYGSWQALAGAREGGTIVYPMLKQESLGAQASQAVREGDLPKLKTLIGKVEALIRNQQGTRKKGGALTGEECEAFQQVFGDWAIDAEADCIAPANIDLILDNIFEQDGRYQVIDCEWIFSFPVPERFLLWRAINELYSVEPELESLYARHDFLEEYGISEQMADTFWNWATYFTEHYVGANRLLAHNIPRTVVSLEEFRQKLLRRSHRSCGLYLDTGNGFSQQELLTMPMEVVDGAFTVTFDLTGQGPIRSLRFDPIEGSPCICQIDPQKTTAKLTAVNASARERSGDLFLTTDPIYLVKNQENTDRLTISGQITVLSMEKALNRANHLLTRSLTEKLAFWKKG